MKIYFPVKKCNSYFLLSRPHESFLRKVCKKLFSFKRTRLSIKISFLTANKTDLSTISRRESSAQIILGERLSTSKEIMVLSGTTMERTFKLCGAIGVSTKLEVSGKTIGPWQLNE